ncbi:MAG TPA: 16S rRNA (cytosine(1402)-N(4))-methyltransferase RsmH [Candidatus Paceibacterota bacterium]|nr:16S rRNA (cytosine(1402)-N(4))-methyltransferase RsmH [Candidatus Paceibacterota bacterium]
MDGSIHKSVLLNETIDGLNLGQEPLVLDATFGGGGHSREVLRRFPKAKVIALDQDKAVDREKNPNISFHNENFRNLDKVLGAEKVDGIIFDLGLSSDQLTPREGMSGRGFSFMRNEPLLMTMKENPSSEDLTAMDVVNTWSEDSLRKIIEGYGEEKFARRIARGIVEGREKGELKTTHDLVGVIEKSVPGKYRTGRIHCATRTFQAIRIAVNDELGAIEEALPKAFESLKKGGRISIISFHSLEDRIAKRFFRQLEEEGKAKRINKKPITATIEEAKENPRSRSAKLRILEKII